MQTESKNQELSQKTEKTNQVDKSQKSISREKVIPDPEIARDGFARIIHYEFTSAYMDYLYNPYKKAGKPIIAFTKFETYYVNAGNEISFTVYLEEKRSHNFCAYSNCESIIINIKKTRPSIGQEKLLKQIVYHLKSKRNLYVVNYLASESGEYKVIFKYGEISPRNKSEKGFFTGVASVFSRPGEVCYEGFYRIMAELTGEHY